ncbi:hypothetical protein [Pseudoalteromonas sp. S1688]|uniref:hypothetical protein n=1 Tax=Pseudoalteromonas sp. S1688 TaxID=579511 RepID=UPI00110B6030|nr:hypothetical protein [Pseudoalteromonas sp. S1688]TMP51473.1 hypothetical protein CWB81_05985 [Pseudoalteromonas sp. S1688]
MNTKVKLLSALAAMLVAPAPSTLETLRTDLTDCKEDIAPFVVAIEVGEFTASPNVNELEISIFDENGKPKKLKPTAQQRDEAWSFYEAQLPKQSSAEKSEEVPKGKKNVVLIQFIRPYKNYVKGDITGRPKDVAATLVKKEVAKYYSKPEE